jgi:EipB-like
MNAERRYTRPGLAALFLCLAAIVKPAGAVEVIPHHAVYELSLKSGGHSEVSDVTGTIEYEWEDACDGWAVSYRMDMTFVYQQGNEMEFGMNVASWESKDGLRYRFFVKRLEGDQVTDEFRGEAELDAAGGPGKARYTLPEEKTVDLPEGTLFPTAHSLRILDIVAEGQKLFWSNFFDGSDGKGVLGVNTVVTERKNSDAGIGKAWPLLAGTGYSNVQLAFFPSSDETALPESEQQLLMFDNGITSELVFDYGTFSVAGKLKELKRLKPSC